jgi:tetratricopeptide (TPR) repeat protein
MIPAKELTAKAATRHEAESNLLMQAYSQKTDRTTSVKDGDFTLALGDLAGAREVLSRATGVEAVLRLAKIEGAAGDTVRALDLLSAHREEFKGQEARYHAMRAALLHELALSTDSTMRADQAFLEYDAAIIHYEQIGDFKGLGSATSNLAYLYSRFGRFEEAHAKLSEARRMLEGYDVVLAEVNDTEAQVFLLEGKPLDAYQLSMEAQRVFLVCGEMRLFDRGSRTLQKAIADTTVARRG